LKQQVEQGGLRQIIGVMTEGNRGATLGPGGLKQGAPAVPGAAPAV